jgi:predicted RNA-binding protein YlxR (DUF448 family)
MKERKVPLRKCIGCQEMIGKKTLVRIVGSPEGEVTVDVTGKKPGRGAYLCGQPDCFRHARKSKGLERALNTSVTPTVYEQLEQQLLRMMKHES